MKKLFIALTLFCIQQSAFADVYPGDTTFTNIVQNVYHAVSADNISYKNNTIRTRDELCSNLVNRHNNHISKLASQSNASFIGVTLTQLDCLNALWYSDGYNGSSGWQAWAGNLTGTWYSDEFLDNNGNITQAANTFNDSADWLSPVKESGSDGRTYDLQSVIFTERTGNARYGWNMSHADVAYVWGWDGKNNQNQGGQVGTHVGWTFEKSGAQCIIWATPEEAFLECVKPKCAGKQRISTGFYGMGQWTIGNTSCGTSGRIFKPITPFKFFNAR